MTKDESGTDKVDMFERVNSLEMYQIKYLNVSNIVPIHSKYCGGEKFGVQTAAYVRGWWED